MTKPIDIHIVINLDYEPMYEWAVSVQHKRIRLANSVRHIINSTEIFNAKASKTPQGLSYGFNQSDDEILSEDFFTCISTRKCEGLKKNVYVVYLTDRPTEVNWFSQFDNERNIIVRIDNWNLYTKANRAYPISYEIICTILRIKMGIGNADPFNEVWHKKPKGCINDLCLDKEEVNLKLRTADICPPCRKLLRNIDEDLINGAFELFELIRKNIISPALATYPDVFIYNRLIWLDDIDTEMTPLEKTIYNFFLEYEDGVAVNDIKAYQNEIHQLYLKFRPSATMKTIEKLTDYKDNSLLENISRLNKKIADILHKENAQSYLILKANDGKLKITLSPQKWQNGQYRQSNPVLFSHDYSRELKDYQTWYKNEWSKEKDTSKFVNWKPKVNQKKLK